MNSPNLPLRHLGLGLMNASGIYNAPLSEADHLALLDDAYSRGETFWDTADKYGASEDVLGKWFAANPDKRQHVFLSTKFGMKTTPGKAPGVAMDSTPEYCRVAIEASLARLGLPFVDLYYVRRLDKMTPIEKTMETMVELKEAGRIKHIGLSECSAESLRRAHAVHPVTAVQVEYSLFCRAIEPPQTRLLETARELGVAVVCYSPLGNGWLANTIRSRDDVQPGDARAHLPWLKDENLRQNVAIVDKIAGIAATKGVSSVQLALAWLLAQGDDVFPIPGTTKTHRLAENLESANVSLTAEDEKALRETAGGIVGGRFQEMTGYAFADTPEL